MAQFALSLVCRSAAWKSAQVSFEVFLEYILSLVIISYYHEEMYQFLQNCSSNDIYHEPGYFPRFIFDPDTFHLRF